MSSSLPRHQTPSSRLYLPGDSQPVSRQSCYSSQLSGRDYYDESLLPTKDNLQSGEKSVGRGRGPSNLLQQSLLSSPALRVERLKNTNQEGQERYVRPASPRLSKRVHYSESLSQECEGGGRRSSRRRRREGEERERRVHYADTYTHTRYQRWPEPTEDEEYNA